MLSVVTYVHMKRCTLNITIFNFVFELCHFQAVDRFVRGCLEMAKALHCSSIAFPAIGTGNLRFNIEDVANQMFKTVDEFKNPDCLYKVSFVIYETSVHQVCVLYIDM